MLRPSTELSRGGAARPAPCIADLLSDAAQARPTAVVAFPDARCSLADLDRRADGYAHLLREHDLAAGEKVALWIPPGLELVAALLGCARAGCVVVPVSDRFRSAELTHVLERADVAVLITTGRDPHLDRLGILRRALPDLPDLAERGAVGPSSAAAPRLRAVLTLEAVDGVVSAGAGRLDGHRPPVDDLAVIMFTSGTSAHPKACMLTHTALLAQASSLAHERYLLTPDSVVWSPLPLFHIAGLVGLLATLAAGATFLHAGAFSAATSATLLDNHRATHALAAFDTIWMELLDHAATHGTDLRSLAVGLSANGAEQLAKLHERLPDVAFVANYGSTEAAGHVAMGRADEPGPVRMAGGGLPLPGMEVRIVDADTGDPVPTGQPGEIRFRGVSRFRGYYRDPAATAAAIDAQGWFASGDLGVLDTTGRLHFRGRLKDMLKVGGENVAALEVESYLLTHPAVNVAAVVGVPDARYGEVPAAFLELGPGAALTETEVIDFCLGAIATYKVPRYVRVVDEWPMSGTKIRKVDLRERLEAEMRAGGVTTAPRLHAPRHSAGADTAPPSRESR